MTDEIENYAHLLEVDAGRRMISIYRVTASGKKQLFTSVDLPRKTYSEDEQGYKEFAARLGENLLLDSPAARKVLDL